MSIRKKIIAKIEIKLFHSCIVSDIDGIKISDLKEKDDDYKSVIESSLNLIKVHDLKRYKRVTKELYWIVNTNNTGLDTAQYIRRTKCCLINYEDTEGDKTLISASFAGLIIHEATHGYLFSIGIPYTRKNRLRIERICVLEQNKFCKKIEEIFPNYKGLLVQEFESSFWEQSWSETKWQKTYQSIKRIFNDKNS